MYTYFCQSEECRFHEFLAGLFFFENKLGKKNREIEKRLQKPGFSDANYSFC